MLTHESQRLREQRQTHSQLRCSHPHYESATLFGFPTEEYICSCCGKVLTDLELALLTGLYQRQKDRSTENYLG